MAPKRKKATTDDRPAKASKSAPTNVHKSSNRKKPTHRDAPSRPSKRNPTRAARAARLADEGNDETVDDDEQEPQIGVEHTEAADDNIPATDVPAEEEEVERAGEERVEFPPEEHDLREVPILPAVRDSPATSDVASANGWPDLDTLILAEETRTRHIQFRDADVELRVLLQVHSDPSGHSSRLGYRARFSLLTPGTGPVHIGYIHTWRINKPTIAMPARLTPADDAWRNELLRVNAGKAPLEIKETCLCLQALFNPDGGIREQVPSPIDRQLVENRMIFVEMIHIFEDYQKQGLLRHAFDDFHHLLARLPEWFAFYGTIVLVPERPEGPIGSSWNGRKDTEVQEILRATYKRLGYTDYVVDAAVPPKGKGGIYISVMGRTIN